MVDGPGGSGGSAMQRHPGRPQWVRRETIEPGRTSPVFVMRASSERDLCRFVLLLAT